MRVQNEVDRFHLVKDAIQHLPQLGNRGAYLIQQMNDKLVEHKNYIHEVGQDLPEILDWKWESWAKRPPLRTPTAEIYNITSWTNNRAG